MKNKTKFLGLPLLFIGAFLSFAINFDSNRGIFTDPRDGNVYQTVTIGNQVWMAENLKYLPRVAGPTTGSEITSYYYVFDYTGTDVNVAKATKNYATYGVLYNWPAALSACPAGWHLPSDYEWTQLIDNLGGDKIAGGKLKATTFWNSPNEGASNQTGFTALPGGFRANFRVFIHIGYHGKWWSATEHSNISMARYRSMHYDGSNVQRLQRYKELGFSVRCMRNNKSN